MPSCPADLDVTSLTSASGSQLNFWIDAANQAAGKKLLVKTGKVNDRRDRLAGYYGLDLSALPVSTIIGLVSRDVTINKRQWAHLRALGDEWKEKEAAKLPFRLVMDSASVSATPNTLSPSIKSAINETLAGAQRARGISGGSRSGSDVPNPGSMDDETVQALIKSANDDDVDSIITLFKLQASITLATKLGIFSEDMWVTKWDAQNKWEILGDLRAIGKEKY
ncbi:hypothetical protein B0H10DRAFT_2277375 [Mycena sp. CBHHK59/15]|nr:hypothetical protein B0H10DRAFT_2277375 [Mycena sp. CBHHK59/15]